MVYYPYVKSMLQLHEDSLKALSSTKTNRFTLSYRITSEGILDHYLFSKPEIDLPDIKNISYDDFNSVQNWKENTLYFVREDIISSKNITFIPVHTSKVYAAVSTNSKLVQKDQLTINDLKGRTVLLPKTSSRTVLASKLSLLFKKYPEITIREIDQGFDLSLRYVAMQDLIAFSTEEFIKRYDHIRYIEFKTDFQFTYGFACVGLPTKEMRHFIEHVKSWYNKTAS